MTIKLPSRYEDLDVAFRGRLRANQDLLATAKDAFTSMRVSGGIRFLPVYGKSGSGKTSAALELGSHLPDVKVFMLPRPAVEDQVKLIDAVHSAQEKSEGVPRVFVVDQYEAASAQRSQIPTTFVESLAHLDRGELRDQRILFIWLTTSHGYLLIFRFWEADTKGMSKRNDTLGSVIEEVGRALGKQVDGLHDLSTYQVNVMARYRWPQNRSHSSVYRCAPGL